MGKSSENTNPATPKLIPLAEQNGLEVQERPSATLTYVNVSIDKAVCPSVFRAEFL